MNTPTDPADTPAQRERDLALLAAGHETGFWDEHGQPAPWPQDLFNTDSGWALTNHTDPENPPF